MSTMKQRTDLYERLLNKNVGKAKRQMTIEETKGIKVAMKNEQIRQQLLKDESDFQVERARRIAEVMYRVASANVESKAADA